MNNLSALYNVPRTVGTALEGVGRGATLGLSDHVAALVMMGARKASGYGGADNTYENALREVRDQQANIQQQNPLAYGAGQVAGAVVPAVLAPATSIPRMMGTATGMGAVQGAAGAENLQSLPREMVTGAGVGLASGMAGSAARQGMQDLTQNYARNVLGSRIEKMFAFDDTQPSALGALGGRAFEAAGTALGKTKYAQTPFKISDVLNQNTYLDPAVRASTMFMTPYMISVMRQNEKGKMQEELEKRGLTKEPK